MTVGYII